jgi:hypothetical protein
VKIKVKKLLLPPTLRISLGEVSMMMVHCRQKSVRSSRTSSCELCFKLNRRFLKFWSKRYAYCSFLVIQTFHSLPFLMCVSFGYVCWQFRVIVAAEFVKQDSWPELVPDLRSAIQNSNLISNNADCQWKTINALTVLHALLRPFQVLNL